MQQSQKPFLRRSNEETFVDSGFSRTVECEAAHHAQVPPLTDPMHALTVNDPNNMQPSSSSSSHPRSEDEHLSRVEKLLSTLGELSASSMGHQDSHSLSGCSSSEPSFCDLKKSPINNRGMMNSTDNIYNSSFNGLWGRDCDHNQSIPGSMECMAKISKPFQSEQADASSEIDGRSRTDCRSPPKPSEKKIPASIQAKTPPSSKTLQSVLSICNQILYDPVATDKEGTEQSREMDTRDSPAQNNQNAKIEKTLSYDSFLACTRKSSINKKGMSHQASRRRRTTGTMIDPGTTRALYPPNYASSTTTQCAEGPILLDNSSHHSCSSGVSSLGMESITEVNNDDSRRTNSRGVKSRCPSVDNVLQGSDCLVREDASPKRPARRRSKSPMLLQSAGRFWPDLASPFTDKADQQSSPRDVPCRVVRPARSGKNLPFNKSASL